MHIYIYTQDIWDVYTYGLQGSVSDLGSRGWRIRVLDLLGFVLLADASRDCPGCRQARALSSKSLI